MRKKGEKRRERGEGGKKEKKKRKEESSMYDEATKVTWSKQIGNLRDSVRAINHRIRYTVSFVSNVGEAERRKNSEGEKRERERRHVGCHSLRLNK